jgi:hypothetical protein
MDRAKVGVCLVGLFGLITIGQAFELASMAGLQPQLAFFVSGGLLISGISARTVHNQCYEDFGLFRRRRLAFWAVALGVVGYTVVVAVRYL